MSRPPKIKRQIAFAFLTCQLFINITKANDELGSVLDNTAWAVLSVCDDLQATNGVSWLVQMPMQSGASGSLFAV